ncbi:MAG TPA: hypothetical protein H9780_04875, partial [Candidatus Mediterraneibacter merdavium]|nr:hypothetical protein [Candidatus Mediterraneibacter merdavium]
MKKRTTRKAAALGAALLLALGTVSGGAVQAEELELSGGTSGIQGEEDILTTDSETPDGTITTTPDGTTT